MLQLVQRSKRVSIHGPMSRQWEPGGNETRTESTADDPWHQPRQRQSGNGVQSFSGVSVSDEFTICGTSGGDSAGSANGVAPGSQTVTTAGGMVAIGQEPDSYPVNVSSVAPDHHRR